MADTVLANFSNMSCDDCGEKGKVVYKHWGPLVPSCRVGFFCGLCYQERKDFYKDLRVPKPLIKKGEKQ